MKDTRLQHATDLGDEMARVIGEITSERTSTSTPQDFDALYKAGEHLASALSCIQAADSRNRGMKAI